MYLVVRNCSVVLPDERIALLLDPGEHVLIVGQVPGVRLVLLVGSRLARPKT